MPLLWISLRLALDCVAANSLRSLLTILGVAIGIVSVVVTSGLGSGFRSNVDAELAALGTNLLRIEGRVPKTDRRAERHMPRTLTSRDAQLIKQEIPGIKAAIPLDTSRQFLKRGALGSHAAVAGTLPELAEVLRLEIARGRMFDAAEVAMSAKVAVLGAGVAASLARDLAAGEPAGEVQFMVNGVIVTAIGVLAPKGPSAGMNVDGMVLMPITSVRNRITGFDKSAPDHVESILAEIVMPQQKDEIRADIAMLLRETHRIGNSDDNDFSVFDIASAANAQKKIIEMIAVFLVFVAAVCLAMGGIGIMNVMLLSVTERTREIGLRLAIGAQRTEIVVQFLLEATALTSIGGLVGLVVGLPVGRQIAALSGQPFMVTGEMIAVALGFAAGTGIAFGLYPALKAARLNPVDALRYD
jgi:putative ABC transport system permease protein